MKVSWLASGALIGSGVLFGLVAEAAPGNLYKRNPYDGSDPSTSSEAPSTPAGYNYGYVTSTSLAAESTSQTKEPHVSGYAPPCPDWVLCPSCPGGYYCPSTASQASPTDHSLVIVPTCTSWKACPQCRGGYKCWKPKSSSTEAIAETTSSALTVTPSCYPWEYCYNCVGGYICPGPPTTTTPTTSLEAWPHPTCSDYIYCPSCPGGYSCPSTTKGSGISKHTEYLPTCDDYQPCQTCDWGWSCPPLPTQTYTIVITRGTVYQTVTEIVPGGYGTSTPSETTSIYNWASYEQPTCSDYIVCPTCPLGYYCPNTASQQASPTGYYYQPGSPSSSTIASPVPSFYPPPPCDNYVVCANCFLGYYCPSSPQPSTTTPVYPSQPPQSYGSPPCDNYVVCPTCPLGYYCPQSSEPASPASSAYYSSPVSAAPTVPSYGAPPCDNYIVCPTCPLGYYCPSSPEPTVSSPIYYQYPSSEAIARTTSSYNWASYEQPTCVDYIVCPSCPLGYYCPSSTVPGATPYYTPSSSSPTTPQPYDQPTCSDYIVCPTCPLGYYCPSAPSTPSGPAYYYTTPANTPTAPGSKYYSKTPGWSPGGPNPYPPSTTYYIGLPTTTLVVAPTCSEYVLCPVCQSGYYCPSESPSPTANSGPKYYYSGSANPENPTPTVPPCDVYVFCPECELGYSCVVDTTRSPSQGYQGYITEATANPIISNPYPTYGPTPSIDATYASASDSPSYGYATVPVPAVPTCANYILCPTCPLGYYCAATVEPTFASSTKYGVVPTGIIESVYSTAIIPPSYAPPNSCPGVIKTVTVTKTRDIYRIYDTCGTDPYALVSSFIVPTVTVTNCDSSTPSPIVYTSPAAETSSASDCLTCPPYDTYYTPPSQTTPAPSPSNPYESNMPQESTSCSFKPCDGGYYCEACPHQWYCPTPTNDTPSGTPYPPYA